MACTPYISRYENTSPLYQTTLENYSIAAVATLQSINSVGSVGSITCAQCIKSLILLYYYVCWAGGELILAATGAKIILQAHLL